MLGGGVLSQFFTHAHKHHPSRFVAFFFTPHFSFSTTSFSGETELSLQQRLRGVGGAHPLSTSFSLLLSLSLSTPPPLLSTMPAAKPMSPAWQRAYRFGVRTPRDALDALALLRRALLPPNVAATAEARAWDAWAEADNTRRRAQGAFAKVRAETPACADVVAARMREAGTIDERAWPARCVAEMLLGAQGLSFAAAAPGSLYRAAVRKVPVFTERECAQLATATDASRSEALAAGLLGRLEKAAAVESAAATDNGTLFSAQLCVRLLAGGSPDAAFGPALRAVCTRRVCEALAARGGGGARPLLPAATLRGRRFLHAALASRGSLLLAEEAAELLEAANVSSDAAAAAAVAEQLLPALMAGARESPESARRFLALLPRDPPLPTAAEALAKAALAGPWRPGVNACTAVLRALAAHGAPCDGGGGTAGGAAVEAGVEGLKQISARAAVSQAAALAEAAAAAGAPVAALRAWEARLPGSVAESPVTSVLIDLVRLRAAVGRRRRATSALRRRVLHRGVGADVGKAVEYYWLLGDEAWPQAVWDLARKRARLVPATHVGRVAALLVRFFGLGEEGDAKKTNRFDAFRAYVGSIVAQGAADGGGGGGGGTPDALRLLSGCAALHWRTEALQLLATMRRPGGELEAASASELAQVPVALSHLRHVDAQVMAEVAARVGPAAAQVRPRAYLHRCLEAYAVLMVRARGLFEAGAAVVAAEARPAPGLAAKTVHSYARQRETGYAEQLGPLAMYASQCAAKLRPRETALLMVGVVRLGLGDDAVTTLLAGYRREPSLWLRYRDPLEYAMVLQTVATTRADDCAVGDLLQNEPLWRGLDEEGWTIRTVAMVFISTYMVRGAITGLHQSASAAMLRRPLSDAGAEARKGRRRAAGVDPGDVTAVLLPAAFLRFPAGTLRDRLFEELVGCLMVRKTLVDLRAPVLTRALRACVAAELAERHSPLFHWGGRAVADNGSVYELKPREAVQLLSAYAQSRAAASPRLHAQLCVKLSGAQLKAELLAEALWAAATLRLRGTPQAKQFWYYLAQSAGGREMLEEATEEGKARMAWAVETMRAEDPSLMEKGVARRVLPEA